jgi:hypothetical protein
MFGVVRGDYDRFRSLYMDRIQSYRPRVSRETRMLLTAALIATVALWALARVRFSDRPAPQNPVQPLLTQLTPRPTFADLAAEIGALRPRLDPLLVPASATVAGLRLQDDVALAWRDPRQDGVTWSTAALLRDDRASGLTLVRVDRRSTQLPALWYPQPGGPRYFIASEMSAAGVALRPVYVAALTAVDNPRWPGLEWQLPQGSDVAAGSWLFTADAALAGLVVDLGGSRALVPAAIVLSEAQRLLDRPAAIQAYIGVDVQPLTGAMSRATGSKSGLVVTWVDPRGPAAGVVRAGEVIEDINGDPISTTDEWDVRTARVAVDEAFTVGVRDARGTREVKIVTSPSPPAGTASLGLTLRTLPGVGVEVVRVDPGSAGHRGGLRAGDVITRAGAADVPDAADLRRAFAAAGDRPLILAFTRGLNRQVTALEK